MFLAHGVSGCFVGTEKPEIALDVPEAYRATKGSPDAALPALDWWRGFRSRELTLLMEAAQTANLDIAAAVARILQADANARIANAALLPAVNLNGSVTGSLSPSSGTSGSSGGGGSSPRTTYNLNTSASYMLDFWGQNRAALLAAQETAIASRFDREVVTLTALVSVATAYFQVLSAQDRLRIARSNVQAATRVLNLVKEREAVGTASGLEVSQQEAVLATQLASIPPLEITLRQNIAALAVLVGQAPERFNVSGGSMTKITVPRVTPGLPADLLNQRPDIREAEAQLASTNYSVESARAAFFPNIQLTGQTGFQSLALASLFTPNAWFYTVAASLTQPIFDGGQRIGQLELQQGRQQEAIQNYRKAVLSAFRDVEQALINLQQQTVRQRLQADAVRWSREAFQISETRLREGTTDLVTVLITQQQLFTAQDTDAQVRLARLLAVISLYQALGGAWPPANALADPA